MKGTLEGTLNERLLQHLQPALSIPTTWTESMPLHDPCRGGVSSHETNSGAEDDCNREGGDGDPAVVSLGTAAAAATGTHNDGNDDNDNGGDDDEPEG